MIILTLDGEYLAGCKSEREAERVLFGKEIASKKCNRVKYAMTSSNGIIYQNYQPGSFGRYNSNPIFKVRRSTEITDYFGFSSLGRDRLPFGFDGKVIDGSVE